MEPTKTNYAFIDSQNLNLAISKDIFHLDRKIYVGWKLDFVRFRNFLKDKYGVSKVFLFIGYIPEYKFLYKYLERAGYICIFKPTLKLPDGNIKGNVDAELVLHTMIEINNFNKAIIVTGDGDFYCLAKYLISQNKLGKILIPNQLKYSILLKKLSNSQNNYLDFLNHLKDKLEYRK